MKTNTNCTTSAYLMEGLHNAGYVQCINAYSDANGGGCIEMVQELVSYVPFITEQALAEAIKYDGNYPGVFDYEVSANFGLWFGKHILESDGKTPSSDETKSKIEEDIKAFFAQGSKGVHIEKLKGTGQRVALNVQAVASTEDMPNVCAEADESDYIVGVVRSSCSKVLEINVSAKNESEAREKAIDVAGGFVFSESDADYLVETIRKGNSVEEESKRYAAVKSKVFASATIPDVYNVNKVKVEIALLDNKIVYLTETGYFGAGLPELKGQDDVLLPLEALWILENHPSSRATEITIY